MRRNEIMQEENNLNKSFQEIFENIKNDVTKTQLEIMINANANLVKLYYRIGKTICENSSWGNKFIDYLSMELKLHFQGKKVFL